MVLVVSAIFASAFMMVKCTCIYIVFIRTFTEITIEDVPCQPV